MTTGINKRISWDEDNKKLLEMYYNEGKTDVEIAQIFNTSKSGINKARSLFGFVPYNRGKGKQVKKKIIKPKVKFNNFVALYIETVVKDGESVNQNHFIDLGTSKESEAEHVAYNFATKKLLKSILILKPHTELQFNSVVKVQL